MYEGVNPAPPIEGGEASNELEILVHPFKQASPIQLTRTVYYNLPNNKPLYNKRAINLINKKIQNKATHQCKTLKYCQQQKC